MDGPIEAYLFLGFVLSVAASAGGVVVVGIVLVKLPPSYFGDFAVPEPLPNTHPLVRLMVVVFKKLNTRHSAR